MEHKNLWNFYAHDQIGLPLASFVSNPIFLKGDSISFIVYQSEDIAKILGISPYKQAIISYTNSNWHFSQIVQCFSLGIDQDNEVWLLSHIPFEINTGKFGSIVRYKDQQIETVWQAGEMGLPNELRTANSIVIQGKQSIWLAMGFQGIYHFNGHKWQKELDYTDDWIAKATQDKKGNLWIVRQTLTNSQIFLYDSQGKEHLIGKELPLGYEFGAVSVFEVDERNTIWVGFEYSDKSHGLGLWRYDMQTNSWFKYDVKSSQKERGIAGVFQDTQGNVWIKSVMGTFIFTNDQTYHRFSLAHDSKYTKAIIKQLKDNIPMYGSVGEVLQEFGQLTFECIDKSGRIWFSIYEKTEVEIDKYSLPWPREQLEAMPNYPYPTFYTSLVCYSPKA